MSAARSFVPGVDDQCIAQALDEESAATLKAVIDNPDQFDPEILDHTSIRGEFTALSRATGTAADYEVP